jgi:hypothetical protein
VVVTSPLLSQPVDSLACMCHSLLCMHELLSTSLARSYVASLSYMSLPLRNTFQPQYHVPLGGFGSFGVSDCRADVVHLCVVQGPAYGGPCRVGRRPGRIVGCESTHFALKPEQTFSVGVPGHLRMLVFVLFLYSSCRASFLPQLLVTTLQSPGLRTA